MRILAASDAPDSTSGYANQLRLFAPRFVRLGHDVAILATFGHQGAIRSWTSNVLDDAGQPITLRVYPGGQDAFANDVIGHSARDWQADIVLTLKDTHVFQPQALQGQRWVPMCPVDHEPLPGAIADRLRYAYRPIAYAPNGFRELRKAGFDPLFCPHGYDPAVFSPAPKGEARKFLGLPDEWFIIGSVAVNRGGIPSRKAWPQNLEAFALFAKDKPNVRFFLHTDIAQDGYEQGINIPLLAAQLGVADKVLFCDQEKYRRGGFPEEYLRAFYCALDVLNAVSAGEGFGIPQLEAQACGCPVITSDFAAARDLCFGGWKVGEFNHHGEPCALKFYDSQASWIFIPLPSAIQQQLETAYGAWQRGTLAEFSALALAGAAEYQIDTVIERYWKPALDELAASFAIPSRGVLRIVRKEEVLG